MFLDYQINYLLWLQKFRDITDGVFDSFFLGISHFGSIFIPIVFISVIYWALNKKMGEFLLISHSFGILCNQFLKMLFCVNRPWIISDKINPVKDALPRATGYSFPSGHTACAVSVWGGFVTKFWENKKLRYVLMTLILLVAFSRNYLGVHTLQDVLVSLVVGGSILFVLNKLYKNEKENKILISGVILSVFVVGFVISKYYLLNGTENYFDYVRQMPSVYSNLGYIAGAFIGLLLCKKLIPYATENISILKRVFRSVFGIIILFLLLVLTNSAFIEYFGVCKGNYIHAFVVSIFITFLYPWVFTRYEKRFGIEHIENLSKNDKDFE